MESLTADEVAMTLSKLEGHTLIAIVVVALGSGLRRDELVALRRSDVDLENASLRVERCLEETRGGTLRFKEPKTKRSSGGATRASQEAV